MEQLAIKPATLRDRLAAMDDREKLLLIDFIADSMTDEGISNEIDLSTAFDRAEETRNPYFFPFYPSHTVDRKEWAYFREERDSRLAYVLKGIWA